MKINTYNLRDSSERETSCDQREEKRERFRSLIKKAFDDQVFFNSRLEALEYLAKQGKVTTAMLTVNIVKVKGFLGSNYNITFSLLYSNNNGQIKMAENFYNVELPGKEGFIPSYIISDLEESESLDIKFNTDDLSAIDDERNIKIDEVSTFDEIINLCQKEKVTAIRLIDRVFYTRIECHDSDRKNVGVIHIGVLHHLPNDLTKKLYPGGQVEYTL